MTAELLNLDTMEKRSIELSEAIFKAPVSEQIIYEKYVNENANIHIGTALKKNRGMVRGGGRKPWRQKGTGRARQGSIRAPHWVGGGRAFGGRRRVVKYQLPAGMKFKALISALSSQLDNMIFVETIELNQGKTKEIINKLKNIVDFEKGEKALLIYEKEDKLLKQACRGIENLKLMNAKRPRIIDIAGAGKIIVTKDAVQYFNSLEKRLKDGKKSV